MQELVDQITNRTGISQEQAQQAVDTVVAFIKTKLPEPLASQVDSFLADGGAGAGDMMAQAQEQLGNLGGMFGNNQ